MKIYDWNKLSTKKKAELSAKKAIFIAGSRALSQERINQLAKQLSGAGKLIWGVLKDKYILGLEGSPQFKTLQLADLPAELDITVITYNQRDQQHLFAELNFRAVIMVHGSWHMMLHLRPDYWVLERKRTPLKLVSPFSTESEARAYPASINSELKAVTDFSSTRKYGPSELMIIADEVAKRSFDWIFQIGTVLAKEGKVLATSHNRIMPYESYTLHKGSSKETNFSATNDQNHYDTNHAEMELIITALEKKLDLDGCDLYINVMPCPACARALARTGLKRIYYKHDHSDGYAFNLFTSMGKELIRI